MTLREQAHGIIDATIREALPDKATEKALRGKDFGDGRVILVAAGKGAWQMANAACGVLKGRIEHGVVVTKYGHVKGKIDRVECFEAGHPYPDENSFIGTQRALEAVKGLSERDTVLFLLSGGGSSLFEKPLVEGAELESVTRQLLACGADIVEINTIRKRLSAVKGGRFAEYCKPAKVYSIILSDVIGDRPDMIASGPTYPDVSTCRQAENIVKKYGLVLSDSAREFLSMETPKKLENADSEIIGSVSKLSSDAAEQCRKLGYETMILTDCLCCQAREAGTFLANIARYNAGKGKKLAFVAGGETVVYLTGKGKGGRNQELALSAAAGIAGIPNVAVFSVGSDGTDGVTDAAGGYVGGNTAGLLAEQGIDIFETLKENDSYHALKKCGGLIITGATGTNVNDVAVVLIDG